MHLLTDLTTKKFCLTAAKSAPQVICHAISNFISLLSLLLSGLSSGVGSLPLKGWPLTVSSILDHMCKIFTSKCLIGSKFINWGICQNIQGIDQIRPGLGAQVQKPFLQNANQYQLLPQQQLLSQVQAQGTLGSSPIYGDMDPQRFRGLSRGSMNAKDGQSIANDGSIGSPMQSTSSKVSFSLPHLSEYDSLMIHAYFCISFIAWFIIPFFI